MKETLRDMLHARAFHATIPFIIRHRRQGKVNEVKVKTEESEKEESEKYE
jgi:hypothetical protein